MKLKYRLSLSFLAAVTLGGILTFALVQRSTGTLFRSLVFSGDAERASACEEALSSYYAAQGSWDGVQEFLLRAPLLADRVLVADQDGMIVADTVERLLHTVHPSRHLAHGVPVMVGEKRVGTVLVGSMIDSTLTGANERFLSSVTLSLLLSTGASVIAGLLLGLILATRITRPLAALSRDAAAVARGNFSVSSPLSGDDEISDLSRSFGEMTAELRRLDESKKRVIADAAHELRTPLTLVRGTVEGILDGVFPADRATLESIHEETIRLSRLVDALRELEIIESGELKLSREEVSLGDLASRALSLFASSAAEKSVSLVFRESDAAPSVADGDPLRLAEVLYNLLSNAIKYTPPGGTVLVREGVAGEGSVSFSVDDSGPGIPVGERERVFERFYRTDKSRASATGGRGLGLSIAFEIVKAHGGSIRAGESSLGGASFTVILPRAAQSV